MKRVLSLLLIAALFTSLAACGAGGQGSDRTPEEWTTLYSGAITDSRSQEENEAVPIITSTEDDMAELLLTTMGLNADDMTAFAISASMMNVQAYAVAAIQPAEGKAETVTSALQTYVDNTKAGFEFYLSGPFEVASNARLETLEDGTVLLVMCEDQDTVFDSIAAVIQGG